MLKEKIAKPRAGKGKALGRKFVFGLAISKTGEGTVHTDEKGNQMGKLMHLRYLLLIFFGSSAISSSWAQLRSSPNLLRSSLGVSGASEYIFLDNATFYLQQSVGQLSAIGTVYGSEGTLVQGFVQPFGLFLPAEKVRPTSLEGVVYPNPFSETLWITFSELLPGIIEVELYDIQGRRVLTGTYLYAKQLELSLDHLSLGNYLLIIRYGHKKLIKKILKN